jgi:ubiquitin carboxyl-terminal hydrolase 26/29/37
MYRSGADQPEDRGAAGVMTEEQELQAALLASAAQEVKPEVQEAARRPLTRTEEEEDLAAALELSRQEGGEQDGDLQRALDLSRQQDGMAEDEEAPEAGEGAAAQHPPEQQYRLHSVVSHFGTGSTSGHYVADVFR